MALRVGVGKGLIRSDKGSTLASMQSQPVLVMFDVDGTLTDSVDFDEHLFADSLRHVLECEFSMDWGSYEHVTDRGIITEVLRNARRLADFDWLAQQVEADFIARLRSHLSGPAVGVEEIQGAKSFLNTLRRDPRFEVAIATGGFESSARMKLGAAGIDVSGLPRASSNDAISRSEIMKVAERRALGGMVARRHVYFGDGSWDLKASLELGYEFFAVGPIDGVDCRVRGYGGEGLVDELLSL